MAESVLSLATTLARIRALAKERQLDLDEILDAQALAARTGVPTGVTAALPRGEEFAACFGHVPAFPTDHCGPVSISTRGRPLSRTQETLLLGMITSMLPAEEVR
ncbi:hypothetical protein SLAV_33035 [Streptomyces lavendulae subsp. lavendulae]|uniref:Uncharacterized protein n=1 Tax=Streptomyces lavendulae subsp. lavendulae TaxID=58340 RepID=A0A2K8PNT7_STRLA|nr:hypothetical protein [Streptomyces lavendulae]ATZ28379.1 hypothetical protein SLAV_33035 [Streptomyces lavendulae subsp. lavendulae]QUQ58205.1 hypothetical protein SLLC_31205 [Streptomyces lavendulae subsp. lavendulae]